MKKFFWYLIVAATALSCFAGCKSKEEPTPVEDGTVVKADALIDAAAAAYAVWEDDSVIPESLTVGSTELTLPQYQYAIAKLLTNLASGSKADVTIPNLKEAAKPGNDSYDKEEIAVTGGEKISEGTEDLVDIANRMVSEMTGKLTVPNSTLITRSGAKAIAFSTNRATVTILRTIAAYKSAGSLPKTVSTEYLSAAASLKGFAQQFISYLDVWDSTVGTVSADGSHCTDNGSAWENVHFIPVPWSGGAYANGVDQYDAKYQPYHTISVEGVTYDAAQSLVVAMKGIIDLVTKEGSALKQTERNTPVHTLADGAKFNEPIPAVPDWATWGSYPWYEKSDDPCAINITECDLDFYVTSANWFLTRAEALTHIGNFITYSDDPDNAIVKSPYWGNISPMRMLLISARIFKKMLDDGITENVYTALKDTKFSADLYGVDVPDIELVSKSAELTSEGKAVSVVFNSLAAWTATPSESWIKVEPASGEAGAGISINISAEANTGAAREGKVVLKGGNVTEGIEIPVTQSKYVDPSSISLKEFAKEFVKGLNTWDATVGTVESEGKHLIEKGTAWENVHFLPVGKTGGPYDSHAGNQYDESLYPAWTMTVNGTTYTAAQAWEIAARGLLDMVLTDGQGYLDKMTSRNKPAYTLGDNGSFSGTMTVVPSERAKWSSYPWYEADDNYNGLTYNGAPVTECDVELIVKACAGHIIRGLVGIPGAFSALGYIGNFQQFGTTDDVLILSGYEGLIAPMRELIVLMRIYKYLLDNNIDSNVYSAIKDVKFDFDMYHQGEVPAKKNTLADFATEFVKVLDVWQTTVGTIEADGKHSGDNAWKNVHYVPIKTSQYPNSDNNKGDEFTINFNGETINLAKCYIIAANGFLNLVTKEKGQLDASTFAENKLNDYTLGNGGSLNDEVAEYNVSWGVFSGMPWYESDDGMDALNAEKVGLDFLKEAVPWHLYRSKANGFVTNWQRFGDEKSGFHPMAPKYTGYCSVVREILILARFYKYLLDNNITSNVYDAVKDVEFDADLYGSNAETTNPKSLKTFATEFVKVLDVWERTVGTIEADGKHSGDNAWKNVHYVPIKTSQYPNSDNNKGDEFTIKFNGETINLAKCYIIAANGFLNLVTKEKGQLDASKFAENKLNDYTLGNGGTLNDDVAEYNVSWGVFSGMPWYESDDGMDALNAEKVGLDFLKEAAPWHLYRSKANGFVTNWQRFGDEKSGFHPMAPKYTGYCSVVREILILARFYKYLLDNNIDSNVYDAVKNVEFDADLYGVPTSTSKVLFEDDLEWIAPYAEKENAPDDVTNNSVGSAPNVFSKADGFLAEFAERGYGYVWGWKDQDWSDAEPTSSNGKTLYICKNYLKFGKTSYNSGIILPALSSISGTADVELSFNWCWCMTGKAKPDIMSLTVVVNGGGVVEATNSNVSGEINSNQPTDDDLTKLEWQDAKLVIKGATPSTRITIRPTNSDPGVTSVRNQNRWYLDNIKIVAK